MVFKCKVPCDKMNYFLLVLSIFVLLNSTLAYKAGVFEYYPSSGETPKETILKNVNEYREFADKARNQSADILIFPEYGLTELSQAVYDSLEDYAVEVDEANYLIKELKAMALERRVYMVVNLLEKERYPNKQTKYYNTNLVFDKNGKIILKYRKINLYDEHKLTPGDANQTVTFSTDFGVTFGIFTCFDIYFENPSRRVLEDATVTDIVFPTAWFSTLPFHTSLTVQHGYASANGVNLLAANYGRPKEAHGGSGIYNSDGSPVEIYIGDTASSKPIIQEVSKLSGRDDKTVCTYRQPFGLPGDVNRSNIADYKTIDSFDDSTFNFIKVDLSQKNASYKICSKNNKFCCTFNILVDITSISSDIYQVAAFDGFQKWDGKNYHLRICSLLACTGTDTSTCGKKIVTTSDTTFTKITVEGNLRTESGTFYTPVTLNSNLLPIFQSYFCNNANGTDTNFVQLMTTKPQKNVVVFGLLGKTNSAATFNIYGLLPSIIIALVAILFL